MKKIAVNTVFTAIFFIKRMNIMNELMNVFPGSPLAQTKSLGTRPESAYSLYSGLIPRLFHLGEERAWEHIQ